MSKWKRTAKQLCKEFWLPLIAATGWVAYNWVGQTFSIKEAITHFSGSFFFVSYMTGQFFRVRKQAGMEASVASLQQRLENVIDDFQEKSLRTINHITGGDSYCFAEPELSRPTFFTIQWLVKNAGNYPMYQVNAKIDDLDSRSTFFQGVTHMSSEKISLGDVPIEATRQFDWAYIKPYENRSFTITFESRNGIIIQDVRVRWNGEQREFAYRLRRNGDVSSVIKEVVPTDFPRDEHGEFDWSEPPLKVQEGPRFHSPFPHNQ